MANPHRGEVSFDAEGAAYTLRYSANSICELEDLLNRSIVSVSEEMASWSKDSLKIRMSLIRAVFWAGLRDRHPEMTIREAGELILSAGGILKAMEYISEAFSAAFPSEEGNGAARPTKSKAGPEPPKQAGIGLLS